MCSKGFKMMHMYDYVLLQKDHIGLEGTNIKMTNTKKMTEIVLKLTDREIELLRNSTSDLGLKDKDCLSLQIKIANALLDAR